MIAAIRSEWIKLRTVTMHWVLGILAFGFPAVITLLTSYFSTRHDPTLEFWDARNLVEVLGGTSFVGTMLLAVLAAASVTGEFGFNTIRPSLTAVPSRTRLVAAKVIVLLLVGLVVEVLVVLVGAFGGAALAKGNGYTIDFGTPGTLIPAMVGIVVLGLLMILFGVGVGLIIRSTPGAIVLLVLYTLLVEALIGQLIVLMTDNSSAFNWLPYRAGAQLVRTEIFEGPSRVLGGLYFGAFSLVFLLLGTALLRRRDT